jgi:hypothetical protein
VKTAIAKAERLAENESSPKTPFGFNAYSLDLVQRVLDDMASASGWQK